MATLIPLYDPFEQDPKTLLPISFWIDSNFLSRIIEGGKFGNGVIGCGGGGGGGGAAAALFAGRAGLAS